ncbi:MAG: zinc ABC transporter permease [Parcubacteria group bacterium Gr01-1014_38]|nr:MAG: zinc ABC transporter permease [Parcubacteria group bacterium Gr01-1014_38]
MSEFLELLSLPFAQRAIAAGIAIAVVSGVLGVFIVLRGMAFFSDAIAHASLLGVGLALLFTAPPLVGALLLAVVAAVVIATLRGRTVLSLDTLIGVFFSAAVALGVITIGFLKGYRADLLAFLFGDVLALGPLDVVLAWVLSVVVLIALFFSWRAVVLSTLHRDLAAVEGVPVVRTDLLFLVLVALVVAVAIRIVGVILVTALLIVPAATAQNLARNFQAMVAWSVGVSVVSLFGGLALSFATNLPSGPTIVVVASALFLLSLVARPTR